MTLKTPISISISRQFASGGGKIGKAIAQKLNLTYMDREIVMEAAKKLGVTYEEVELHDEKFDSFWKTFITSFQYGNTFFIPSDYIPSDERIHRAEAEMILDCAKKKPILVVGRGGNFILENESNHVSIFIHADESHRIQRLQSLFEVSAENARKWIHKTDALREEYVFRFTGNQMYDLRHYNLVIDTSKIGFEAAEEVILSYLKLRFGDEVIQALMDNKESVNE